MVIRKTEIKGRNKIFNRKREEQRKKKELICWRWKTLKKKGENRNEGEKKGKENYLK